MYLFICGYGKIVFKNICKSISPENVPSRYAIYDINVLWYLRIRTILFGDKYDFIFLLTKSAEVHLFHQYKIKLLIWSARKQRVDDFRNLNCYIFVRKQTLKWRGCNRSATARNVPWVISNMAASTMLTLFVIADSTLKEYEIITLIYNRKHAG